MKTRPKLHLAIVSLATIVVAGLIYYSFGSRKSISATGRLGSACREEHASPTPIIGGTAYGWSGWISGVSPGLYASDKDLHTVGVYLDDLFVGIPQSSLEYTRTLNRYDDVQLCCLSSDDARSLAVGQRIVFCGLISNSTEMINGGLIVDIASPVINPGTHSGDATELVPDDFYIMYEAHGCGGNYSCPDYSVVINAEGDATYEGYSGVRVPGKNTTAVSEKKLRELVLLLQHLRFFEGSMSFPSTIEGNIKGSTLISVTMNKKQKTVAWDWDSSTTPRQFYMLENKINEVVYTWQWTRLWPDLTMTSVQENASTSPTGIYVTQAYPQP